MLKWHVNAALGLGRPLSDTVKVSDSIALSLRQFHISALRAQDEEQSPSQVSTYRARRVRLQDTTQEIQNLYSRSAARSNSAPFNRSSDTGYRSINLDSSAPPGPAAAIDARSLASRPRGASQFRGAAPALRGGPRGGNSNRGERTGGRGGRNARGGRGGRERGDREPRRSRISDARVERQDEGQIEYTEAEKQHRHNRRVKAFPRNKTYQVQGVSRESLVGDGPAVAVGEFGMSEMVEERLRLVAKTIKMGGLAGRNDVVRRVLAGKFVKFENEQEKQEVLAEVERVSNRGAELRSEEKGEIVEPRATEFVGLEDSERKAFVEGMLKGEYTIVAKGAEGVLAHLMRSASRNETYLPEDGSMLLEKVRTLLPAQKSRPAENPKAAN